ncbi:MAG: transglycosylase SLT domain-containing protein [Candidatus Woesearchaeota archaeon]
MPLYFSLLTAAMMGWHSYADGAPRRSISHKHHSHQQFVLKNFPQKTFLFHFNRSLEENSNLSLEARLTETLLPTGLMEEMDRKMIKTRRESLSVLEREARIDKAYHNYQNRESIARNFTQTIHREPYATLINQALDFARDKYKVKIPYSMFISLVQGESNWSTGVTSKAGAQGLMQFMPATSKAFGCNPRSARQLLCGGQFLAKFYRKYEREVPGFKELPEEEKWNWVLLGYNWGPNGIPGLIHNTGARTIWELTRRHLGAEAYEFVSKIRGIERAYLRDYQNPSVS